MEVRVMGESPLMEKLIQVMDEYERDWQRKLQDAEKRVIELEQENENLREELENPPSPLDEINDEALKKRLSRLGSPPLDTFIREAGVVLEHRLRTMGEVDPALHGTQLVDAVFNPDTGKLIFSSHRGEQDGVRMLYRGAMQFIRNPPMHKLIEYPESTARLLIRLVDALLQLLSEGERETGNQRRKKWTEEEFFKVLSENTEPTIVSTVRDLYEWGLSTADRVWFGTGIVTGSFNFHYLKNDKTISVFTIYTNGTLTINYGYLSGRVEQDVLEQFHERLTRIPGFRRIRANFSKYPSIEITDAFGSVNETEEFKKEVLWLKSKIHSNV
jgi:hypothetical protein